MKKFKYILMALPLIALTACSANEGTEPGHDAEPAVTLFSYSPSASTGLNPDNDVILRFCTNSAAKEVYYIVEPAADFEAFMAAHKEAGDGDAAYTQYVMDNGEKFTVNGAENVEINVTGLSGEYSIAAVASDGTSHSIYTATSFQGLDWDTLTAGQFFYNQAFLSGGVNAELQICKTDDNLYRIKDAFGEGYSIKFTGTGKGGVDNTGMNYQFMRVPNAATPYEITLSDGNKYSLFVCDIATWQDDASFATNPSYACIMWEDGYCQFSLAWMVSAGCIAYEDPSYFEPAE